MNMEEWAAEYLRALPSMIRPDLDDSRFATGVRNATRNGWLPKQMAKVVEDRNYSNARNPVLLALMRLEEYATRHPHARAVEYVSGSGCIVCKAQRCEDPITNPAHIPQPAWAAERAGLLLELGQVLDMGEDEREHTMRVLITDQRTRARIGGQPGS